MHTPHFQKISLRSDGSVGVEHDSEGGAHSSGGEVLGEGGADESVVAVSLDDLAPDGSELGVVSDGLALVDVGDSLAKVKACVLLLIHALHLQQSELLVLSALASLESGEHSLGVQSKCKTRLINSRSRQGMTSKRRQGKKNNTKTRTDLTGWPVGLVVCFCASFPIFIY